MVPDLWMRVIDPSIELTIENNASPDSGADRHKDEASPSFAGTAQRFT